MSLLENESSWSIRSGNGKDKGTRIGAQAATNLETAKFRNVELTASW
jgi:hypothetical protein